MDEPSVRTLLDAVRRHLWRERGRVAVRHAGWLSAATMLLAGAVHLAASPLPVDAVLAVLGLEWASLLGSVAWRRPGDAHCALWIDRHLGGASAFTTLLDPRPNAKTPAHAQALRWLERWAQAKVPDVLRSLGERRSSVRVAPPLLAMAVCAALALFVLTVPDTAPTSPFGANVRADVNSGDTTTAAVEAPVAAQLTSDIANALRSTESPSEAPRRRAGDAPAAGENGVDDVGGSPATASPATPQSATPLPANASMARESRSSGLDGARASAGPGRSVDAMAGHLAGDSPDTRADPGMSRPAPGTIAQSRSGSPLRGDNAERRADMERAVGFDEGLFTPGGATSGAMVAAAAAPPPAVIAARLSPVEASYVQAWMKATGRSR